MKILVSSCAMGNNVRWNGANKNSDSLKSWADENNIELIPVCPENEIFGTPRPPIRLVYSEEKIQFRMKDKDVNLRLHEKCKEIHERYPDAAGFIGISGSPSCGISVGVKKLGRTIKAPMHSLSEFPTTEIGYMKKEKNRAAFLERVRKYLLQRSLLNS